MASRPSASSPVEACLRKQPPHVGQDLPLVVGVGWHPVHDDEQWQAALLDAGQDGPRHLIGVAGRGRHEDAQVGCLDEPVGQGAIGVLERIDVRCVDEDEARLDRVVGHQTDLFGWNARESAVDERLLVVRVDQDDRHAGGRAEDAGRAGGAAGDRVEDRALAGARRSDEEDHDGGIQGSGTHADVTAQVIRELAGPGGRGLAPRAQRQAALRE